jgi:type II secretory pathway pseudopilin PulG
MKPLQFAVFQATGAEGKPEKMFGIKYLRGASGTAPFVLLGSAMSNRPISRQGLSSGERGYTMVEMVLTFVVIAIMAAMMVPKIGRAMRTNQVNRSIALVASDMEAAYTLAARQRKPVRVDCTCGSGIYTVADRAGTVLMSRNLRADNDLGVMTLTFTAAPVNTLPVEIFPPGISDKNLTVRITSGTSTRAVFVTTAGQVRIIP